MGSTGRFFLALMVAVTTFAGGSLLWPRLTTRPRPKLLQDVHDLVLRTPVGQHSADVLGVSDETTVEPINIGAVVGSVVNGAKTAIQKRVQTVVVTNAVNSLSRRFESLPPEQKEQIQEILCKPIE